MDTDLTRNMDLDRVHGLVMSFDRELTWNPDLETDQDSAAVPDLDLESDLDLSHGLGVNLCADSVGSGWSNNINSHFVPSYKDMEAYQDTAAQVCQDLDPNRIPVLEVDSDLDERQENLAWQLDLERDMYHGPDVERVPDTEVALWFHLSGCITIGVLVLQPAWIWIGKQKRT